MSDVSANSFGYNRDRHPSQRKSHDPGSASRGRRSAMSDSLNSVDRERAGLAGRWACNLIAHVHTILDPQR